MPSILYRLKESLKKYVPVSVKTTIRRWLKMDPSRARREANRWLRGAAADVTGDVLSIGSRTDCDKEGGHYRDYFVRCASYITSDVTAESGCDLVIDVRSMPQVKASSYDAVFCSGVLEHVDDYRAGLAEITRVLKPGGILLLGLPFRQAIHLPPDDFWRFTEFGIRDLLKNNYDILELVGMDQSVPNFPATYWVKARKR